MPVKFLAFRNLELSLLRAMVKHSALAGPPSEIHLNTRLEDVHETFRSAVPDVADAVVEAPFQVGMEIPVHAGHNHGHASAFDVAAVKIHVGVTPGDFPRAPAAVAKVEIPFRDNPPEGAFRQVIGAALAGEK